jgi:hypothetical protein
MCCDRMGVAAKNFAKVTYYLLALFAMLVSLGLMFAVEPLSEKYGWKKCEYYPNENDDCFGQVSVLRMSFSLVLFHLVMLLILVPRQEVCGQINDGCWVLKYIILIGLYIASWFISQPFFVVWGNICRAFSILYLFGQSYFIANLAYLWNEKLLQAL